MTADRLAPNEEGVRARNLVLRLGAGPCKAYDAYERAFLAAQAFNALLAPPKPYSAPDLYRVVTERGLNLTDRAAFATRMGWDGKSDVVDFLKSTSLASVYPDYL
jgi:hypothetical protein